MNKITKCENYYTFDSLEELYQKVDVERYIEENFAEWAYDIDWAEPVEEDFRTICSYFGIENVETCWDVGYNQGRGASFTGKFYPENMNYKELKEYAPQDKELLNIFAYLETVLDDAVYDCDKDEMSKEEYEECLYENKITYAEINRCRNTYYCHSNTICVEAYSNCCEIIDEKIINELENVFVELADWFFEKLEAVFNEITSENYIAQYIVDNKIEIPEEYLKDEE